MKKRWVSLLLVLIISVAAMPAFSLFAAQEFYYCVEQTFEELETKDTFSASKDGLGVSFLSEDSKIKIVGSDLSLWGKRSLAINKCDMSWNALSLVDEKMYIGISIMADAEFDNELKVFKDALMAFSVSKSNGKAVLKDCNGQTAAELENETRYSIYCEFTRESELYDIYVNDILVADNCNIGEKIYSIGKVQILTTELSGNDVNTTGNIPVGDSYIIIDNVLVYAKGKSYPQKYSAQATGEIPEISIPKNKANNDVRVFVNATEIAMPNKPVSRKNTIYVDLEQLARCTGMTISEDKANKKFVFYNDKVKAEAVIGSKILKINEKEYTIANAPERINGVIMVSPNFLSEVLNAKVWWDKPANMVVITPGSEKRDGILRNIGGKLYMNGEPYYEIGYNKIDLFNKVFSGKADEAETTLRQLNELGVKSVRVFTFTNDISALMYSDKEQEIYFKAMDDFFDLCDKYKIKVVACLGLDEAYLLARQPEGQSFIIGTENSVDLVANSQSESRMNVYKYLEKFISRYKDRDSVLMWEIANEMNIYADNGASLKRQSYSLLQLSEFYGACADKIREFDEKHLISCGDGMLRSEQWNSFKAVMNGEENNTNADTSEDTLKALMLLNGKSDVVSVHTVGNDALQQYMSSAEKLNKVLYNGVTQLADSKGQFDLITELGVQLSHWVDFDSVDTELNILIQSENNVLKEKYCANSAEDENTTDAWENPSFQVVDSALITDGMEFAVMASFKSKFIRFCILSGVTVATLLICVILLTREKLKRKRTEDFV